MYPSSGQKTFSVRVRTTVRSGASGRRPARRSCARSACSLHALLDALVGPEPDEDRLAESPVRRPLLEADLDDELGLDPGRPSLVRHGPAAGWSRAASTPRAASPPPRAPVREAAPDASGVDETAIPVVHREVEGAEARPGASQLRSSRRRRGRRSGRAGSSARTTIARTGRARRPSWRRFPPGRAGRPPRRAPSRPARRARGSGRGPRGGGSASGTPSAPRAAARGGRTPRPRGGRTPSTSAGRSTTPRATSARRERWALFWRAEKLGRPASSRTTSSPSRTSPSYGRAWIAAATSGNVGAASPPPRRTRTAPVDSRPARRR